MRRTLHILFLKVLNFIVVRVIRWTAFTEVNQITRKILYLKRDKLSLSEKLEWEVLDARPYYGYGTYHAAKQAVALGMSRISVIEFGVAGGKGLVELEQFAAEVSKELNIEIEVYGFDGGQGMPPPLDYRDMPYIWQPGFFEMDQDKLRAKLKTAKLIIGNVTETVTSFVKKYNPAPIGFISFDLDYYSATAEAFKLLDHSSNCFLPRVYCYFDDIMASDVELHGSFTGELLAIDEFNQKHAQTKISIIHGLSHSRKFPSVWNEKMYACHFFKHPLYCTHTNPNKNMQLEL